MKAALVVILAYLKFCDYHRFPVGEVNTAMQRLVLLLIC